MITIQQAAARRAEQAGNYGRPRERRWHEVQGSAPVARAALTQVSLRAKQDNPQLLEFYGCASATEQSYEMWDFWGPYNEIVSQGAFGPTLARSPDVAFLLNHGGMTMARTKSGTLRLGENDEGLAVESDLDARMSCVRDMQVAIERGDLDEMSFAFRIVRGQWSPDYTEYRIDEVDIDRGDVSVVNFGANPATSAALRSGHLLDALATLEGEDLAEAQRRLAARAGADPAAARTQAPADPAGVLFVLEQHLARTGR